MADWKKGLKYEGFEGIGVGVVLWGFIRGFGLNFKELWLRPLNLEIS
jgi:hypothetical protein